MAQHRQRRRARTFPPEMLNAVRDLLASGSSAPEVEKALYRMQGDGELQGMPVPSPSTIKSIGREMARDDSPDWTLEDATPESVGLVLRVVWAAHRESRGRITTLTRREAQLAAVYLAALPGIAGGDEHRAAWRAYVRARAYLAGMNRGEASWPEHIDLAAQAVLEAGLEYRPGMTDPTVKEDLQ